MSVSHASITCQYHMPVSHVSITSQYHMSVSHVSITCQYHMSVSHVSMKGLHIFTISRVYIPFEVRGGINCLGRLRQVGKHLLCCQKQHHSYYKGLFKSEDGIQ